MIRKERNNKVWVSRRNLLHAKSCKSYYTRTIGAIGEKNIEYINGYHIYLWCKQYLNKLDFSIINFWVVKKDHKGLKRGQKIMSKKKMLQFTGNGGKVREIRCYKKETRKAMRQLIEYLDLYNKYGYGFTNNKDIFTQMEKLSSFSMRRNFQTSVVSIDLQDAFTQITQEQIYCIFRHIFKLNTKDSEKLAEICCYKGRLFQGNTIAPLLFNLWFARVHNILHKQQENNMILTNYADDLTLITLYKSMSHKYLRFIIRILKSCGFTINKQKLKIYSGKNLEATGLQYKFNKYGEWKIYPRKQRKLKNLIRLWEYLDSKGIENTLRTNALGQFIKVSEMINGLKNWEHRCSEFQPF